MGLCYIGNALLNVKYKVGIIDSTLEDYNIANIVNKIIREKPKVIGISVSSLSLHWTYILIRLLRKKCKAKIILGGPHISYEPYSFNYLKADYGLRGDSEFEFLKLVDLILRNKGEEENISGLLSTKKVKNSQINIIDDLNSIPLQSRQLLDNNKYVFPLNTGKVTTIITTRGAHLIVFIVYVEKANIEKDL